MHIDDYTEAVQRADFLYHFTDDPRAYRDGRDQVARLRKIAEDANDAGDDSYAIVFDAAAARARATYAHAAYDHVAEESPDIREDGSEILPDPEEWSRA